MKSFSALYDIIPHMLANLKPIFIFQIYIEHSINYEIFSVFLFFLCWVKPQIIISTMFLPIF